MEIPLGARVECTDGACGQSLYVLVNPVTNEVTHLVVSEGPSLSEYIVPVEIISESTHDVIKLSCNKSEFQMMDPFINTEFVEETVPDRFFNHGTESYGPGSYYYLPYVTPEQKATVSVEERQIPPEELAVKRGTRVEATDGVVGHIDEFVVDPESCHITHLVMREGHLWGQKDVIIPVSLIKNISEDTVFLKLDKHGIESLPAFPIHRLWS